MQENILRQIILFSPVVGIEISDTEGRITETNSFYRKIVGYDETEIVSLFIADLSHQEDLQRELLGRKELYAGDRDHFTFRKRYLTKAGNIIWGNTTITAVRDADDSVLFVALMVDATELHRQDLLQQGRTRVLELLYKNRPMEDVCLAIVESIEAVEEGLLCSILRLNSITGRLHKLAAPSLPDFFNDAIEGMKIGEEVGSCGAAAYHGRRVVAADILNHPYWQRARRLVEKTSLRSCWSQPIFDNNGKVLGTFAIYYTQPREPGPFELDLINSAADLTALAINHTLAQSALKKSDQLKSEFISTAAHELNTPLAAIMGYVDLLRHGQGAGSFPAERNREFLDIIGGKVDTLARIVNDLLDISKIESGYHLTVEKRPVSIRKLLASLIDSFERLSPEHLFGLKVDEKVSELFDVDEGRIVQMLDNLLGNAVKYSPLGGTISVEVDQKPTRLQIVVADQGIGMTAENLERIFEKFYRANISDTSVRGLGLGMSIVREIIEAHGGEIRVESVLGEGTRVEMSLPV